MATIYRFIVEQKASGGSGDSTKPRASKGAAKKGSNIPFLGGGKGGVEHNRKMRAINPILNKVTNGVWEKGMRLSRAGIGLISSVNEKGIKKGALQSPSLYIILAFALITTWNELAKWNQRERANAQKLNAQNFKAMENGSGTIHGAYSISSHWATGHITYNENK